MNFRLLKYSILVIILFIIVSALSGFFLINIFNKQKCVD